jgi:hypothetical protein
MGKAVVRVSRSRSRVAWESGVISTGAKGKGDASGRPEERTTRPAEVGEYSIAGN